MGQGQIIDQFPGSSLDAAWTPVTAGDAAISVVDNTALLKVTTATAGADAAALVRTFDRTLGNYHRVAVRLRSNAFVLRPSLWLLNDSGTPAADSLANINAKTLIRSRLVQSTNWFGLLSYWNTGGTEQKWSDSSKTWTTGTILSTPQISNDDYHIIGFDWDDVLDQVRMFWTHRATGSTFSEEAHGPKLFALTDWVALSGTRDGASSTLKLVLGELSTSTWSSGDEITIAGFVHEWADSLEDVYTNQHSTGGASYTLKHHDMLANPTASPVILLPESRTATVLALGGSGEWDERDHKWGNVVYDPVTAKYWMCYCGQATNGDSGTGIASSMTGKDGSWTKYASNPVLPQGTGDTASKQHPTLIKDDSEPDSNKRWKLVVTCLSATDSLFRVFLFSAAQPDTTSWTLEGLLLDQHASDGDLGIQFYGAYVVEAGTWHLFYAGISASPTAWHTYRAHGSSLAAGSLTKDRSIDYCPSFADVEMTISAASSTSRIVDVNSTTGVVANMQVLYDHDATSNNWRIGRVRRVISSTQLELYHLMPGIGTSGVLRSTNRGKPYMTALKKRGSDWEWWGTHFAVMYGHATFVASHEGTARWISVGQSPHVAAPTMQWFHTPGIWLGRDNNNLSAENPRLVSDPVPAQATLPFWMQRLRLQGYRRPFASAATPMRYGTRLTIRTRPLSFDPNQVVQLQAAVATGVAVNPAVALGGLTVPLSPAIAIAVSNNLGVVLGGHTIALPPAIATAIAQNMAVTIGGIVVPLSPAVSNAIAPNLGVLEGFFVPLGEAIALGVVPPLGVALGGLLVPLSPAVATAVGRDLLAVLGGLTVPLTPAVAQAIANDLVVTPGGLNVALTPAVAAAIANDLEALVGDATTFDPAVASGVAQGLTVNVGGIQVPLNVAIATTAAQGITVTLGGITVSLQTAIAQGVVNPLTVVEGQFVALGEAIANAVAQNVNVNLGGLTVGLTPAVATAVARDILTLLGNLPVQLTPAIATAVANALGVLLFSPGRVKVTVQITPSVALTIRLK